MEITHKHRNALGDQLKHYTWTPILIGESSSSVFRLEHREKESLYLKIAEEDADRELHAEAERLKWIAGRIRTPRLISYLEDSGVAYLLTTALAGADASVAQEQRDPGALVRLLAEGLREIHETPIGDCPFDQRLSSKIEVARDRMLRELVDESDFDDERRGKTAEELFELLIMTRPATEDVVFTHGDYCFPNIIIEHGRISGFIDWSRSGVADRYQDLALAMRSMDFNTSDDWSSIFLEAYGIETLDKQKVEFYQLLDEFF